MCYKSVKHVLVKAKSLKLEESPFKRLWLEMYIHSSFIFEPLENLPQNSNRPENEEGKREEKNSQSCKWLLAFILNENSLLKKYNLKLFNIARFFKIQYTQFINTAKKYLQQKHLKSKKNKLYLYILYMCILYMNTILDQTWQLHC